MKRRDAIRNVVLVSAGVMLLKSCTREEGDLLAELTETIIPKTDFPGAKDLQTSQFIITMKDDCSSPDDQAKFTRSMQAFDEACKSKMGDRFVKLSKEKREEFLGIVEADKEGKDLGEDVKWFYGSIKGATIQNFTTSQQFLAEVRNVTTLIPAKFQACVPVTTV